MKATPPARNGEAVHKKGMDTVEGEEKKSERGKRTTSIKKARKSGKKDKTNPLEISGRTPETLYELEAEIVRLRAALELEIRKHKVTQGAFQKNERSLHELKETALRQAQELTLLDKVRATIATKLDMSTLLKSVIESIVEVYGYTHVSIYLLERDELVLHHQMGYQSVIERIGIHEGVSGKVARTAKAILVEDVRKDSDFLAATNGLVSEITVPLLGNNQVVGTLSVESTQILTKKDLKILETLSADISPAIGRARLYEDIQKQNRTLSALQESTVAVLSQLDLPEVLQAILTQAAQLIDTKHGYIYFLQPDGTLKVELGIGIYPKYVGTSIDPGEGLAGKVWQTGKPLIVNDYPNWKGRSKKYEGAPFHAVIGIPLLNGSQVEGVLGLAHLSPERKFSQEDTALLVRFGYLASLAITNASLYTRLQQELIVRKQAEQELQTSENHFRSIFEQSPLGVGIVDTRTKRFLQVNPRYCEITGRTSAEMLAMDFDQLTHPDDRNISAENNRLMLEGKTHSFNFEKRYIRPDQSIVWVHLTVVPLWETEADPRVNLTMVEDITEQKNSEIALRESEEKYRNLIEHLPAAVYLDHTDLVASNFYISSQVEKMLGYSPADFYNSPTTWLNLIHPEDYDRAVATIEETLNNNYSSETYRLYRKDGQVIWVRDTAVLIRDAAGIPQYIQGFLEDITASKQAAEALKKSEQRLQAFFNQSLDGFFFCDFEEPIEWKHAANKDETLEYIINTKRFTDVNDAMLKQYGINHESFLKLTTRDIFIHDIEQGRNLRRKLFDQGHLHLETYERTSENIPVWFEGDYVCLYDAQERITGFFGIQRDITERKRSERELRRHVQNAITMYELSQRIHKGLDLNEVYQETHYAVQKLMPCDSFLIATLDKKANEIEDVYLWEQGTQWLKDRQPIGEGLTSYIISTGKPFFVNDWNESHTQLTRSVNFGVVEKDTRSVIAVPLFNMDGTCFGMMSAQSYPAMAYTTEHEQTLITLANQVSKAIENANLFSEIQKELSERKRAEEALRESEERYRTLFAGMLDGVYRSTHEGRFVDVNPSMVAMFGFGSREEMLAIDIKKELYFSPGERNSLFLDTGQEKVDEFRMKRKDGSEIWVEDHGRYVHDADGNVIYHEGILRDITERKHAEVALRRSETFTKSIIENEPECVKIVTAGGILQYMNPAGLRMIEADNLEQVEGRSVFPIIARKDLEDFMELTEKVLKGEQGTLQFEIMGLKGTKRWLDTHAVPMYDEHGNITALLGLTRDITEQKRAAEAVHEAEEKYRSIFENSIEGIYQSTPDGRFHTLNPAFANLLGYASPQEMIEVVTDIANQVYYDSSRRADFIQLLEAQGSISGFEYQMRRKDGKLIWVSENARLVRDINGNILYYEGILEDITSRKQNEQRIDNQLKQLNALHVIDNAINSNFELRSTLDVLLREVTTQLKADATSVLLFNKETLTLDYTAGRGFLSKAIQHTKLNAGEGYAGRVILDRKMIHIADISKTANNRLTDALNLAGENFAAYVGSPLIAKGQVVGVLEIFQRTPLIPNPDWFDFLAMIADQAAIAIDNAQLFENLQRSNFDLTLAYDATIEGWSRALDLRDKETEGHTQRVTNLTLKLSRQMGIPDADILHIRRGALLHDIGKMGIPDSILHKPNELNAEEWNIMRQHTNYAYQMLTPIIYLKPALDIPRYHHERWDGAGYPDRLSGEQIPIAARIFAVVDVWDALTSDRSYRDAWSKERAIDYIKSESGKHFDPKVVSAFLSLIQQGD